MARRDRETYESYDKDVFDNPPSGPIGVHQGNPSFWSRLVPYLVVIVVAAAAGVLVWGLYSGEFSHIKFPWRSSSSTSQTVQKSKTKAKSSNGSTKKKSDTKQQDASKKSSETNNNTVQQQQSAPAPSPNKQTAVRIVNGTRIAGYAASKQTVLNQAGYQNVSVGNLLGQAPTSSVVWYQDDADKVTADDVAQALGITAVQQQSGLSAPITVVLLN